MAQEHMSWDVFTSILLALPPQTRLVSLQGEGEPMLNPLFWDMAKHVLEAGMVPYTITNGSALVNPMRVLTTFPRIGVSIDTLDADLAERVGRYDLKRVLKNLDGLLRVMRPDQIDICTVDFGQYVEPVKHYALSRNMRWCFQPLQTKPDYAYRYGIPASFGTPVYHCAKASNKDHKFFTASGKELPCCLIKNVSKFLSREHIVEALRRGEVPASCTGCREIHKDQSKIIARFPQEGAGS